MSLRHKLALRGAKCLEHLSLAAQQPVLVTNDVLEGTSEVAGKAAVKLEARIQGQSQESKEEPSLERQAAKAMLKITKVYAATKLSKFAEKVSKV